MNRTQRRAEQRRNAKLARKASATSHEQAQEPAAQPQTETAASPTISQTSEAQITANRENATHSTGPRSESGKAAVSQNRRTHGLNCSQETFTVLPCENQADFDRLLQTLLDEQKPQNTVEHILVSGMAQHRWLLNRANRLQETCLDPQTGQITDQKLFTLYLRYATTHERAFHKCLNDLAKLRKDERTAQIGFESNKRAADRHQLFLNLRDMEEELPPRQASHRRFGRVDRRKDPHESGTGAGRRLKQPPTRINRPSLRPKCRKGRECAPPGKKGTH